MRLGGFYGFTAPMLLMVYNDEIRNTLNTFNVKLNSTTAVELKKELWHFKRSVQSIKTNITLKDDKLGLYANTCMVTNGEITGSQVDDFAKNEIMDILCNHCAIKLYENIVAGKTYDLQGLDNTASFNQTLYQLTEEALAGKTFALTNINVLQRAFIKLLKHDVGVGDINKTLQNIRSFCNIEEHLPNQIYVDDRVISLNDEEIKVIDYFKKNINKLDDADSNIHLVGFSDDNIFNISFVDFLNRKPSCLYYMIVRQFNHLKNSDIRLFPNILAKVQSEFKHCKELIKERLLQESADLQFINRDELESVFEDADTDVISFLSELYDTLTIDEISLDDLIKLKALYYAACYLSLQNLNSVWGTSFTYEQFNQLTKKLNELGLGGVNLFTDKLYKESLKEIIFTNGSKINKSAEYMEELLQICDDIEAFLGTFLEIGGELNV